MRLSDSKYGFMLSSPGLIIILALIIFPILTLFVTSFLRYTSFHPISWGGLKNYIYILNDRIFWMALKQTGVYTVGVTLLTFVCGVGLALALSNIKRGAAVFRSLAMFSWAVPLVISGFIWKWMFNPNVGVFSDILMKIGLISEPLPIFSDPAFAMLGCIIADAWVRIPFMCIFILAGVESISEEVYDAAKIDGADCISTFWYNHHAADQKHGPGGAFNHQHVHLPHHRRDLFHDRGRPGQGHLCARHIHSRSDLETG